MRSLRQVSVGTKLLAMTVSVASVGILFGGLLLALRHRQVLRDGARADALVFAGTIAEYATAAMVFGDQRGAADILAKLRTNDAVIGAELLDIAGRPFARYGKPPRAQSHPPNVPVADLIEGGRVMAYYPMEHERQRIGTLGIELSTKVLEAQMYRDLFIATLVSIVLIVLCAVLAARLQRFITGPILQLSNVMRRVGEEDLLGERVIPPSDDELGTLYRGFNSMLDQIRARAAERDASEARLRALVQALPDLVLVLSETGRYLTILGDHTELFPGGKPSLAESTVFDALTPEVAQKMREAMAEVLADGQTRHLEYESGQGHARHFVEAAVAPLELDAEPGQRTLLVVARDATERRTHQEERAKLEAQLHQAERLESIGRLAGGVAHDFNNLLTPILIYTQFAADSLPRGSTVRQQIEYVHEAAESAAGLTRQLLAFGRRQSFELREVDINKELESFQRLFRRVVRENIIVEDRLDPRIGKVRADPSQVQRIFMNLGMNAADAMPHGGHLTFETEGAYCPPDPNTPEGAGPHGACVVLRVRDTGTGMDEETLGKIFDPFFSTKVTGKGTGLGLPTVYGLVMQHGGKLSVQSELGKGTTFEILLPCAHQEAENKASEVELPAHPLGHGETILLVEDDDGVRTVVKDVLMSDGYQVIATASPIDGIRLVRQLGERLDLLLTDIVMPELNGHAFFEQVSRERPGITALFISGYPEHEVEVSSLVNSGQEVLEKPLSVDLLRRKVRDKLAQRSMKSDSTAAAP